jgi:UDP-GlcNAc:undecaprenyl-phosphate GlcNAc-1-phosphate transferase
MTLLGFLDDKFELRPGIKFAGQLVIAAAVTAAGVRLGLFVANPLLNHAVTILWILTVTNAFNFLDNMNGLCAGLTAIAALLVTGIATAHGQFSIAVLAILTSGASLGFLPYNYPRASSFLGDAGSHLLGFLLATLSIQPGIWPSTGIPLAPMLGPILLLAVPLLDLLWVVILRTRMGQPFYIGDNNHLSHRLVRRGLSRTAAVALIWILAALIGGLSVLL